MHHDQYPLLLLTLAENDRRVCYAYNITQNRFEYTNPAFRLFFRIAAEDITRERLLAMIHPEDQL
jgi:hypothetical protein